MIKIILSIYSYFSKRKLLLFGLLTVLIVAFAFAASHINFREDISAFLPKGRNNERINYAYQNMGSANKLLVSVRMADTTVAPNETLIIDAVKQFVAQLQQADTAQIYFKKIEYKVEQQQILAVSQFIVENMPYFLTEQDYQRMDTLLTEAHIRAQMRNNKRMLMSPIGMVMKQNIMADPLHIAAPILQKLQDFQISNQFQLYDDFIFSKDRKEGIITIESQYPASETLKNAELLKWVDHAAEYTQLNFKEVKIHYFGAVDIAVTNANRIKKDTLLSSLLALVLILCILIYAFRSTRNLLIMLLSLVFGWLFAIGLLSILQNEVSLIAVGISSIIIGIAVNYPLHFILHHRHENHIPNVIKNIVIPLTIGNITTVGAFLSLMFISSDAMQDLGLFAAALLVGVICFVLFFIPHLLKKNSKADAAVMEDILVFGKFLSWKPKHKKWITWGFIGVSAIFIVLSFNTKFETDMQKINYMTQTQKEDFKKYLSLIEQGQQTIYYISEGANLDEALMGYESSKTTLDSLQEVGKLTKVNSLGVFLPSKAMQQQRLERWQLFCKDKIDILKKINAIGIEIGFKPGAFHLFDKMVCTDFELQDIDYFEPLNTMFTNNYISNEQNRSMVMTVLYTLNQDLDQLETQLNTINNQSFSFDAGTIGRSMVSALSEDFDKVLFICGFIVFAFLMLTLGRIELTLIAFIPLTFGWFWILGIMDIFDIRFNIVNIILATFIFGQGDDYTIFMTEGLMYEYTYKRKLLASYKNTIMLSSLIMFIGIGTLILAKHPALRSLAQITIVGMGSVALMAFLLPPTIFRLLTMKKGKRRLMPVTLINFLSSVFLTSVFFIGSMGITIVGFFMFAVGKTTDKKKLRYHKLLCRAAHFEVACIPRVKTTYNQFDKSIFDKPAVIICNHQSHLDLMSVLSLTPKLILLTNDWVWNSPVFGRIVKYVDFYPVSNGIENALDKLQAVVEKGYSIMVFPEGTRSEDCSIQRFHSGAFYLAEQLKLDILPVLIHGVGHFLPKKEFMLRKGKMHINVLPRIPYNAMGDTFIQCAKNMRKFYQKEYAKLSAEIETPDYYADLVIHNYVYKGVSVERTVRHNLKKHNNYNDLIRQLSVCNRVLITNCGYGEMPLLLSLVHKHIHIVATDSDKDKLELAANCTWVKAHLKYVESVSEDEQFDAVINLN